MTSWPLCSPQSKFLDTPVKIILIEGEPLVNLLTFYFSLFYVRVYSINRYICIGTTRHIKPLFGIPTLNTEK